MKKNSLNNKGFFVGRRTLLIVCLLILVPLLGMACNAADYEDYAPIFYFEGEETCYPVNAEFYIENSFIYEFTGGTPNVKDEAQYLWVPSRSLILCQTSK